MKLTEKENKYIQRLIQQLERDNKYWPWLRWIMLFASILLMGSAFYIFNLLGHLQETLTAALPIPKKELDSKMVELFVSGQLANLKLEFLVLFKIAAYEILSIAWLVYCLKNWNRHIKNGIIIKAIKEITSEKEQEN